MILAKGEKKKLLSQLQDQAVEEGRIPSMPFLLLRKMAVPLQFTGALLLGFFLGTITVLVNFFIVVNLFVF
jgi:hypothetical protein